MEIKDGRITPTNNWEESIVQRLLEEQEAACYRDPTKVTLGAPLQQLSESDTYKVFCAVSRAVMAPEAREKAVRQQRHKATSQGEMKLFEKILKGLAMNNSEDMPAHLEHFSLEEAVQDGNVDEIVRLAGGAIQDRYQD